MLEAERVELAGFYLSSVIYSLSDLMQIISPLCILPFLM